MQRRFFATRSTLLVVALLAALLGGASFFFSRQSARADNNDPAHYDNIPGYTITGTGNTWINNSPAGYKHVQTYIQQAVVDSSGCVHTKSEWDEGGSSWGVYCNGDAHAYDQTNAPSPVDNTTVTINGDTWSMSSSGSVQDTHGAQVSGLGKATALGVDIPDNYLMVGDDGVGQHVVKFYDVSSGSPSLVRTFGTVGGIRAGVPGEVTPTKFWGITGVGTDSDGNIYVAGSQQAAFIRSFTPDGNTLRWQLYGLHFSHSCDFDTSSDGTWLYCGLVVYQMDYSKPVDQQWQLKYYTMDLDTYPNDIRNRSENSVWYRVINGRRYLFDTDMNNLGGIYLFKQETGNSYIFAPAGQITADDLGGYEGTYQVDDSGNVYKAGCDAVYYKQLQGADSSGNLTYGTQQRWSVPGPFNCAWKMYYDQPQDVMYLGGGTPSNPVTGWGEGGPVVARYSHWSDTTQRTLDWQITVPLREDVQNQENLFPISYASAGGYLFVSYVNRDADYAQLDGESGVTRVYRESDGGYIGRMLPDGPGGVQGSWIDIASGAVKAMQRADGTILIMREENWLSKQIIYMWNPGGSPPPTATPTPTPSLPSPWQSQDIGSTGQAGSSVFSNNLFTVSGSGSDIWGTADAFQYASQPLSGDGTIVARVASQSNSDGWAKAGVMIREALTAGAKHAFMALTPGHGVAFQRRTSTGGSSTNTNTGSNTAPYWVKLVRAGSTFTGYVSSNGSSWTQIGSATISMASSVFIGLAVTSHNNGSLSTATFTNVSVTSGGGTGSGQLVLAINAGGGASGSFVSDRDANQGNQYSDTSSSIDTSGVSNAAPQAVWQTCRWNSAFTYTIPSLTAGASYKVQLDWAELSFQAAGSRLFNVAINGSSVLSNFDVYASAGFKKALVKQFSATADSSGTITIAFTQGTADNPFVNGIELYTA